MTYTIETPFETIKEAASKLSESVKAQICRATQIRGTNLHSFFNGVINGSNRLSPKLTWQFFAAVLKALNEEESQPERFEFEGKSHNAGSGVTQIHPLNKEIEVMFRDWNSKHIKPDTLYTVLITKKAKK